MCLHDHIAAWYRVQAESYRLLELDAEQQGMLLKAQAEAYMWQEANARAFYYSGGKGSDLVFEPMEKVWWYARMYACNA